jgi:hypothetical protein
VASSLWMGFGALAAAPWQPVGAGAVLLAWRVACLPSHAAARPPLAYCGLAAPPAAGSRIGVFRPIPLWGYSSW